MDAKEALKLKEIKDELTDYFKKLIIDSIDAKISILNAKISMLKGEGTKADYDAEYTKAAQLLVNIKNLWESLSSWKSTKHNQVMPKEWVGELLRRNFSRFNCECRETYYTKKTFKKKLDCIKCGKKAVSEELVEDKLIKDKYDEDIKKAKKLAKFYKGIVKKLPESYGITKPFLKGLSEFNERLREILIIRLGIITGDINEKGYDELKRLEADNQKFYESFKDKKFKLLTILKCNKCGVKLFLPKTLVGEFVMDIKCPLCSDKLVSKKEEENKEINKELIKMQGEVAKEELKAVSEESDEATAKIDDLMSGLGGGSDE